MTASLPAVGRAHDHRSDGLIALGVVLWLLSRAIAGPPQPVDPAALVD
jgi:hypothetical protein